MRSLLLAATLSGILVAHAAAQVLYRPTPRPERTAVNESWFLDRAPIFVAGDYYYPAGASVFFDANTMVLSGFYGAVPIYSDTTLEPHSLVFVPVGRGLMQPYERRRAGDIVGTTGSRAPSFPLQRDAEAMLGVVPGAPAGLGGGRATARPAESAGRPVALPETSDVERLTTEDVLETQPTEWAPAPTYAIRSARTPNGRDGVWIEFRGARWFSAGPAVTFDPTSFQQAGEYGGFPVYRSRTGTGDLIYIPTRDGIVAPYVRK